MSEEERKVSHAIYPGTFDPITNGHVDLVKRALEVFDKVTVLIAHSKKKSPLFSAEERKHMILHCLGENPRLEVDINYGLLVEYAKSKKIPVILRGLRAVSDFDYEFQMAAINRRMYPELETFFLMASENQFFVNSTLVKEVIAHKGNVSTLVPKFVEEKLKEKLC